MQEARGTAQALREGVTQLKSIQGDDALEQTPPVESMLDALDGAIEMLGDLESAPHTGKDRRGRIDAAALLFILAPEARISLEPGAGTEVFGVESDLKRMLGVLLGQPGSLGTNSPSGISIRRDGDWVRISVEMGPEGMPRGDLESRWLSRMAVRQGGRVEFERRRLSLVLPAHRASEKREIEQLRKELEQAQRLGEVYARELAESLGSSGPISSSPPSQVNSNSDRLTSLIGLATSLRRVIRPLVDGLREDLRQLSSQMGESNTVLSSLLRRANAAADVALELERVAQCPVMRRASELRLSEVIQVVTNRLLGRSTKLGVAVHWEADDLATIQGDRSVVELLVYALLDQAIQATPIGQQVEISARCVAGQVEIRVEDGGPVIPDSAMAELQTGSATSQSLGRPAELMWLIAGACAETLRIRLKSSTSANLRSEIRASIPRVQ